MKTFKYYLDDSVGQAGLRLQGRMLTKGKSPYSLDNPKDVIALLSEK
jgi:hypothetical protein